MSDIAIRCEGLSKQYKLGEQESYKALRDTVASALTAPFKRFRPSNGNRASRNGEQHIWALKDVSCEIKHGEVVGIIGRNGSGKSTFLKILSRITKPTEGYADVYGRIGSLLEVGTGFHPELSGRENIYLNGAILGMKRAEINRKFDEIVDFAEIEKFIDTPVKRYSSGMYVRLAFAVAAHLEPELLVIDEVLAVGDAQFQKKCLGKMREVGQAGRTVLFVSHNMSVIQTLCKRVIVLNHGRVIVDKDAATAVHAYLQDTSPSDSFQRPKQPNGEPTLISGRIILSNETPDYVKIETEIFTEKQKQVSLDLQLTDSLGAPVGFGSLGALNANEQILLESGSNKISFALPVNQLALGSYLISIDLTQPEVEFYDRAEHCLSFEVTRRPHNGATRVLPQSWNYGSFEISLIR